MGIKDPSEVTAQARIGQPAPYFEAESYLKGEIKNCKLSDYKGKYVVLYFYPKDFTFVCPTEIINYDDLNVEFQKVDTVLLACSVDSVDCHLAWCKQPRKQGGLGHEMTTPLLSDLTKAIAARYGCLFTS